MKQDGFPSDNVEIVLVDNDQNIWFSGNGITKLNPKTDQLSFFDFRDGLQGNSFKIGAGNKDKDGILYFGGIYGLNYFNPRDIKSTSNKLNVILTDLYIHSKLIVVDSKSGKSNVLKKILNETDVLTLRHNQNDFSISFSALNYWTTSKIMYRYRLTGYNNEWQYINGQTNKVFYSNLDYKDYKFEIQVSSDAGTTWNENSKTLEITVLPPWWLSMWAKIIYFVLLVTIAFALILFYSRELKMKHQLEIKDIEEKTKEENHQLKLQFFMNISHEFKTPLTLILSSIEQLNKLSFLKDEHNSFFESISRNAHKMLNLITELMDFRKTDIAKDTLKLSYNNAGKFIKQIAEEFEPWAKKKNVNLFTDISENIELNFDKEKIAKIVSNLLSNAIKYTDEGGSVEVVLNKGIIEQVVTKFSIKHVEQIHHIDGECLIFIIRDTGIGITPESIPHIFDRFFQVESKTSMHLGSGIGLAVAKNMTLSHKGKMIVSSERNVGTEFIFAIPMNISLDDSIRFKEDTNAFDVNQYLLDQHFEYNYDLQNELNNELTQDSSLNDDKPVLLIVEDNVELLQNLQQYFMADYAVMTAENGQEGLDLCKNHYPDLVISDVMMPVMDGIQLCAAIRENLNIAYTPIILLTANSEVEHQIQGYEAGADLYIPKPFSLKLLELNVKRLIAHKNSILSIAGSAMVGKDLKQEPNVNIRGEIKDAKDHEFIKKLHQLINENLDNTDYSVENLCRELGVGRTKLYTKVKDITGEALGDLIRDIRLNKSAYLLRNTDMNITEVIYDVGFGSNSHFSKAFKAKFGMTPSEYAKSDQ